MQTAFLNFAAKSVARAGKNDQPEHLKFSAKIFYILEHCKTQNAALIERSAAYWRRAIDISVALKQSASLNFYRSSSQRFFKIPRFKSQQGVKIIYNLVKCGIGHVRCAQAGR